MRAGRWTAYVSLARTKRLSNHNIAPVDVRHPKTNEHHPKNEICSAKVVDRVDIHLSEMYPGKVHEHPSKERVERWQFHDFRNALLLRISSPRHDEKADGIFIKSDTTNGKNDEAHERFSEEGYGNG